MSYEDRVTDPDNMAMRLASGQINDQRPLVTFLYLLGRDQLSLGTIEELITRAAAKADDDRERRDTGDDLTTSFSETMFTNGWLAQWAQYTAEKLT